MIDSNENCYIEKKNYRLTTIRNHLSVFCCVSLGHWNYKKPLDTENIYVASPLCGCKCAAGDQMDGEMPCHT